MANFFDQFDAAEQPARGNLYDQFDGEQIAPVAPAVATPDGDNFVAPPSPYSLESMRAAAQAHYESRANLLDMRARQEEDLNPTPNPLVQQGDFMAGAALQVAPPVLTGIFTTPFGPEAQIPMTMTAAALGNRAAHTYAQARGLEQPSGKPIQDMMEDANIAGITGLGSVIPTGAIANSGLSKLSPYMNPTAVEAARPLANAVVGAGVNTGIDALYQLSGDGDIDPKRLAAMGGIGGLLSMVHAAPGTLDRMKAVNQPVVDYAHSFGFSGSRAQMVEAGNILDAATKSGFRGKNIYELQQWMKGQVQGADGLFRPQGQPRSAPPASVSSEIPAQLQLRIADKTPVQASKAIREQLKLEDDPIKKAALVDVADRIDRDIAQRDAAAEQQQLVVDTHEAQTKIVEDAAKAQQKARQDAQKLAMAQAKAQGEQVQAIMEAQTPPEPLQASKPMVLANSASQVAKGIEDNPESAQAQLNKMTQPTQQQQPPEAPGAAPVPQQPNLPQPVAGGQLAQPIPPGIRDGNKDAAAAAADKIIMAQNAELRKLHGSDAFPNIENNPNRPANQRALAAQDAAERQPVEPPKFEDKNFADVPTFGPKGEVLSVQQKIAALNQRVAAAATEAALKPIPANIGVEYLGKNHLVADGVGPKVDQWQVKIPGQDPRGLTVTADQIRAYGYRPPEITQRPASAPSEAKQYPFVEFSAPTRLKDWLKSPAGTSFMPDANGTIPAKSVIPLLKKLGVSKEEMALYPQLNGIGSGDARVQVGKLANDLEAAAKIETVKLSVDTAGSFQHEFDQSVHRLETQGFRMEPNPLDGVNIQHPAAYGDDYITQVNSKIREQYGEQTARDLQTILDGAQDASGTVNRVSDAATGKYGVEPKQLKDMPGAVDILVRVPMERRADGAKIVPNPEIPGEFSIKQTNGDVTGRFKTEALADEGLRNVEGKQLYRGPHFGESDKNVLASVRGYVETLPSGEKAFHVFEVQSDWGQKAAKTAETISARAKIHLPNISKKNGVYVLDRSEQGRPGYTIGSASSAADAAENLARQEVMAHNSLKNHPLLSVYEQLGLKAAVAHAREIGAKYIAVSDAETAMMTEGHDRYRSTGHMEVIHPDSDPAYRKPGDDYRVKNTRTGEVRHFPTRRAADGWIEANADITQEPGMRAAYDKRLPAIMQKLTGDKGKVVDFGEHKSVNGYGTLMGGNPDEELRSGSPAFDNKTNVTARIYSLKGAPSRMAAFGYSAPSIFKKQKPALEGKSLTVGDIQPASPFDEPTQAAPTQEAPGTSEPAADFVPPDNLEGRRRASARRQQRGAASGDVVGGLGGAAASGAYGFLSTHKRDDETEEQFQTRRLIRSFAFGLGGGLAGGSAVRLFGGGSAARNIATLAKIKAENKGIDSVPKWYQNLRQTGPMVKFRQAINNSRAIVKDIVGNAAQEGVGFGDDANPYATGKVYAARVAEAQRKAGLVMADLQNGVVEAGKSSGIGVDNFINRLNIWMEARHTPYYNKHLADLHAASGGTGPAPTGRLSDAESTQVLADAQADGLTPVFNNLYTGYKGVVDSIRDTMEQGGLITPETRKVWETKFPEYVPMNRILPDDDIDSAIIGHIGGGPGISVLGSGVRKIKGSELDVSDIAGNLMANWNDAITRVAKNEVAKSAGNFFKKFDALGTPYEGVEVRKPKVIGTSGSKGDKHPIFEPFRKENMVSYMVGGKPNWIVFRDPRLATAFSNLNTESQNRLMRIIATPTRVLSRAFTGYNLDFLAPNVIRDRQSAAWKAISQGDVNGALQQINPVAIAGDASTVASWIAGKTTPRTQLFQQMMDDGGMPGGFASSTRQKSQDFVETLRRADTNIGSWTVQKVQKVFNYLSEISEGETRLRAYERALELGASRQEAAVQGLNSSIDFNQKGTVTPSLGAFYAFFNPAMQGGVNAAKNLLRSKDAAAVLLASLVGLGASVDAWNSSFDPQWKSRKAFAYSRTNGIPLIYGTDPQTNELKYFTIPMSQELRPFKAMSDFALEMSNGEIRSGDNLQDELGRVGGAIVSAANPLGADPISHPLTTVTPTVGRPLLEIASNRDYADRPIVPDRLATDNLIQPHAQRKVETYNSRTGRMAIALSDWLKGTFNVDVSPEHMKYLVNSYGGGPARTVSSSINSIGSEATGFKASDLPVVGSFVRRTPSDGLEKTTKLYKDTEQQLSDAKTADELARQHSKLFFANNFDKVPLTEWATTWRALEAYGLIPQEPAFRKQVIDDMVDKIKGRGDVDKLVAQFGAENGERAAYYGSRKRDFKTDQEYLKYLQDQAEKKLLTAPMVGQIKKYLDAQK